jgi:hypothetical protein
MSLTCVRFPRTPEYARVVIQSPRLHPDRNVDRSVDFRMARQEALSRSNPATLEVVIGEPALRQRLGGAPVLQDQLRHLLDSSRRTKITVRILPYSATRNPGIDGPFTIMHVETGNFAVVVIESLARSIFLEDDTEVTRYEMVFENLCAVALPC